MQIIIWPNQGLYLIKKRPSVGYVNGALYVHLLGMDHQTGEI